MLDSSMKACITCRVQKDESEFYAYAYTTNAGARSSRLDSRCKACARARRKSSYERDGDRQRAVAQAYKARKGQQLLDRVRAYRELNRDKWLLQKRAYEQKRRSGGSLDSAAAVALVATVLEEARIGALYMDAYSGELISAPEVDHIVPLSRGGRHEYGNLCVTSAWNNRSKKDRPLLAWMAKRARAA